MTSSTPLSVGSRSLSLTDRVMEHVRTSVITGAMHPDELYSVYQLADQLGFSRSPVRDGLLRLEEAGLIQFVKNRGFRVLPTTPEDVAEIVSIRIALEVPAARRAARSGSIDVSRLRELGTAMAAAAENADDQLFFQLDQELHDLILVAGGARRARQVVDGLRDATRLLGASTADSYRGYEDIRREHDPVVEAILAGDVGRAGNAMQAHLVSTGRLLVDQALRRAGRSESADELWERLTADYVV